MLLQLTTAPDPGDADSSVASYAQLKILGFDYSESSRILLYVQHGNTVASEWVSGVHGWRKTPHEIKDEELVALLAALSNSGEGAFASVYRLLYEWLRDTAPGAGGSGPGPYPGTLV